MCTLFIAIDSHPDYPLIIAGNRDEFYQRKTAVLQDWGDIVGGRDLQQGGHWLAADKQGRWAALTNYRNPEHRVESPHTRGDLVKDYLQQSATIDEYIHAVRSDNRCYEGFNLLLGNGQGSVAHYSNVTDQLTFLSAGIYGLSNALLDTPWPKVVAGKAAFAHMLKDSMSISPPDVFDFLSNAEQAPTSELPSTGLTEQMERLLSSLFIRSPAYGTLSSALITWSANRELQFFERRYSVTKHQGDDHQIAIQLTSSN